MVVILFTQIGFQGFDRARVCSSTQSVATYSRTISSLFRAVYWKLETSFVSQNSEPALRVRLRSGLGGLGSGLGSQERSQKNQQDSDPAFASSVRWR